VNGDVEGWFMAKNEGSERVAEKGSFAFDLLPWAIPVLMLVLGGLTLAARAEDSYMAVSGALFAAFGVLLGFRLVSRTLP
jgi:hypothetical protein